MPESASPVNDSIMGFGGVKQSGTGWKEAGLEALDVYSETQYVNLVVDPELV